MSTLAWLVAGAGAWGLVWGAVNLFGAWLRYTALKNEATKNPASTDDELLPFYEQIKKANRERQVGCGCLMLGRPFSS